MKECEFYAHSTDKPVKSDWQSLDKHLQNVAKLAAEFAIPFGGQDWARLAGLWHDLGKYSDDFQRRLEGENIRVVHSEAGGHQRKWVAPSRGRGLKPGRFYPMFPTNAGMNR